MHVTLLPLPNELPNGNDKSQILACFFGEGVGGVREVRGEGKGDLHANGQTAINCLCLKF